MEARSLENCVHCGNANPQPGASPFCCTGCESVHAILSARGLADGYYRLLSKSSPSIPRAAGEANYTYLDDPQFLNAYAADGGRQMRFYLENAHCAACIWLTEKIPDFVAGAESLSLNLATSVATVRIQPGGSFAQVARELQRVGYPARPVQQESGDGLREAEDRRLLARLGVAGAAAGNIMLLAAAEYAGADGAIASFFRWVSFLLFVPVVTYSAVPFYKGALGALRARRLSIDVPIVLGIAVGTLASAGRLFLGRREVYFDSVSMLVFLLLGSRYLILRVHRRAAEVLRSARFRVPARVRLVARGQTHDVALDAVKSGDVIEVLAGECFPVDGVVADGKSTVDLSLLTGESAPAPVSIGAQVQAGTTNLQGPLRVRVEASGAQTRLASILSSVEQGLTQRSPWVSYLDEVGRSFVGATLVLSAIAFYLGLETGWDDAIQRAIATAIVVCPCTFALATPLAMSLAIARCARAGIIVKNSEVIERLASIQRVFFDKTGTLTQGQLAVTAASFNEVETERALVALERRSAHPVAQAVIRKFGLDPNDPQVEDFVEEPGRGLSGTINGHRYSVCADGDTIGVFKDGLRVGGFCVADPLRPESREALRALDGLRIPSSILSGDSPAAVMTTAKTLELDPDRAKARLTPEQKADWVRKSGPGTLMVGDGANDAPALAAADVGLAVQGGMDISLRAAGAYSSRSGPWAAAQLVVIGRETMTVIRRNLGLALLYNALGVAVALSGRLSPLAAAVLMPLSALTLVASTLAGTRRLRAASEGPPV